MTAMNEIEASVLEMVAEGTRLQGCALEVLMEMTLREMEG